MGPGGGRPAATGRWTDAPGMTRRARGWTIDPRKGRGSGNGSSPSAVEPIAMASRSRNAGPMRFPLALPSCVLLAAPLLAQANAVPGLDARIYAVGDVGAFGRRGPTFPGGEAGFGIGHSYCNAGAVNIPWSSSSGGLMIDTYPKIAFLLARELNGRLSQVSGKSFLKHSRTPFNFSSGPCAPCNSTGGAFMFVGCSDTY